jgi:hypothetical protein
MRKNGRQGRTRRAHGESLIAVALQAVLRELAAEGIAVHAEEVGSPSQVPVRLGEHLGDELLLELARRIVVADALW